MAQIDERVVAMSFETAKFDAGVQKTIAGLKQVSDSLNNMSKQQGLEQLEASANKVTLKGPMSALDRLKAKLGMTTAGTTFSNMERDSAQVKLQAPQTALDRLKAKFSSTRAGVTPTFADMERSSQQVKLQGPQTALDRLKAKFGQTNAGSTFADMERASHQVTLGGVSSAITNVSSQFSILQGAAAVVLGNIATRAVAAGANFVKSFALGPITQGLQDWETQINSIQVILANTGLTGQKGLNQVNSALDELNHYADKTIYNFAEMARNIGTFTAAGVNLETATASIKGIANLAALSGSSSMQASTAMYQLSQAIATGTVTLMDWKSVENAGMGGRVFQKALWDTAKAMGTLKDVPVGQTFDEWRAAGNSFRKSISADAKTASSGASQIAKAQKDGAEAVRNAQEAAAESVQNAKERVTDAQKRVAEAHTQTAETVKAARDRVVEAESAVSEAATRSAEAIKNAKDRVKEAQQGVRDAARQSREDIQAALTAQEEAVRQSAENVKSALDGVTEAQKRLADALKPPSTDEMEAASDRVKTAQLDQADLADAVTQAQQEQQRSSEDLADAQRRLAELQRSGASAEEIRSAQRAVEDATRRAADASDAQERALLRQRAATRDVNEAQKQLTETQKKGTAEDENVKNAQNALTEALARYKEAQDDARESAIEGDKRVTEARQNAAKQQKDAAKALLDAEKDLTKVRKDSVKDQQRASEQLIDAQKAVVEARKDGAEREKEASQAVIEAQKNEVKATRDAQENIAKAHEQASERVRAAREAANPQKAQQSWLTSDVLTNTLKQFTGDMSEAELKAQGFSDAQIKAIQATGKVAVESATKIKTLSQLTGTLKEEVGSAWAGIFETVFGSIDKSTALFTGMHKVLSTIITGPVVRFSEMLEEWARLGGRKDLLAGLTDGFEALKSIFQPLKDAFRQIFPPKTGADLVELTKGFRDFMESLKIGPETANNLKRTFAGLFAVLDIGWQVIKQVVRVIFDLLGAAGEGSGGILAFTGSIGDFLVKVDNAIKKGDGLKTVFDGIAGVLKLPIRLIGILASAIAGLFGFDSGKGLEDSLQGVHDKLGPLERVASAVQGAFDSWKVGLDQIKTALDPWFTQMADKLSGVGDMLDNAFRGLDYDKMMSGLQTGLLAGILLSIKKAFSNNAIVSFGKPFEGLNSVLKGFTGQMEAMQSKLHAEALLAIAGAVVVLAAGIFLLSKIPADDLAKAMTAVSVGLAELMGAMKLMTSGIGKMGILQLPAIAIALIGLATAVLILAGAMKIFATMSWEDIAKGMAGVAGSIAGIGVAMKLMGGGPVLVAQAAGLILIGVALNIIAAAVKIFSTMKWEDIAKGLFAVVEALGGIALGMSMMPANLPITAAGLILVGVALNLIGAALKVFGTIDFVTMLKGLAGMGAALVVIAVATSLFPPTMPLTAAGLVIMATALTIMAGAIAVMGNLKLETLVKGIAAMGAALVVLAMGLTLMAGTLPGAAGLLAAAAALAVLAPTLGYLGTLDISTIIVGLAAMGAAIVVVGLASEVAAPGLISLGIALVPLSLALVGISAAVYLFAKALSLVGDVGPKAVAVLIAALTAFVMALPDIVIQLLKGLLDIIDQLTVLAPKVVVALGVIIDTIIAFVIANAPKLAIAIGVLVDSFITVITENAPKIIAAGFKLLMDFLSGLSTNIGQVVTTVTNIIVNFLNAVTANLPRIIAAGVGLIVAWIGGIASKIGDLVSTVVTFITSFVTAVANNLGRIASAGANLMVKFIAAIGGYLGKVLDKGTEAILKFLEGVSNSVTKVVDKGVEIAGKFITSLAKALVKLVDTGFDAIIDFLNGIARAIRTNSDRMNQAGWNVASAIIDGMINGIRFFAHKIWEEIKGVIDNLPRIAKKILGISSPSSVFADIGRNTMRGMVVGFTAMSDNVVSTAASVGENTVSAMRSSLEAIPDLVDGIDVNPTITPVLDLSQVERDAGKLGDLTNVTPITAASSYGQAAAISADQSAASAAADQAAQSGATFEFNQYNTSPKALSEIEIYRQTNNQLSQLKSAVGLGGR